MVSEKNKSFKTGNVVHGIVKSIEPFGAFVEVYGKQIGLLHISDICKSHISHPGDMLRVGSKIKVQIKKYDKCTGKLSFSTSSLYGTWDDNIKKFSEKSVVNGIVRNKDKNGVYVELTPNLVGVAKYKSGVSYGDEVSVFINKISNETQKVKLSILA